MLKVSLFISWVQLAQFDHKAKQYNVHANYATMPYHYSNLNLVQMKKKSIVFVVVSLLEENRDHLHWSRLEILHEKLISYGTNTKVGVGGGVAYVNL